MTVLLRRCAAARLLPVLLAVEVYAVLSRGTPWLGEWGWTIDWVNGATILLGPLIAGCAALDAVTWSDDGLRAVLASTPRGATSRWHLVWANAAVGAVVHLLALVGAGVATAAAGAGGLPDPRSVPVSLLVLLASAGVGTLVATAWPSILAAPLSAVGVFALTYLASSGAVPPIFRTGGVTGTLVGLTWDPSTLLLTGLCLLAVVAAALATLSRSDAVGGRPALRLVLPAAVVVLLGGSVALSATGTDRFAVAADPPRLTCADGVPRVCLAAATSRQLDWLATGLRDVTEPLRALDLDTPAEYRQVLPGGPPPVDAAPLRLESETINRTSGTSEDLVRYATAPSVCAELEGELPPPQAYFDAIDVLGTWLLRSLDGPDAVTVAGTPWAAWFSADEDVQDAWVTETYTALVSCRIADVAPPEV